MFPFFLPCWALFKAIRFATPDYFVVVFPRPTQHSFSIAVRFITPQYSAVPLPFSSQRYASGAYHV